MIYKPSVVGRTFKVKDGDDELLFKIEAHETIPEYFTVNGYNKQNGWFETSYSYLKTTVWEEIDRGQWILQ